MADVWLHIKADNIDQIESKLDKIEETLSRIEKSHNLKFNTSGISNATRQVSQLESAAKRVENVFSGVGRTLQGIGGGMQSLGNLFGGRIVNTAKTMATAFGTMGLFSAAQGTVARYDTMRMYPKQMALLGFSADAAASSVDKLEQSVIGLPTGLDEIVESARQLVTLTGDLDKGTNLAIAANNALLAGGADTQQQTWGQRQIRDLLSAGKLRTQEWESLIKALGPGLKDIGEAMGYADYGQFRSELKQNKVAAEDFLDALVRVGTGEGVLAQRAELYKDTLSATARNIKNAVQKLGAAGLDALDKVLENETGKNLPQTIVEISDAIKGRLVPALEGWIGDHSSDIVNFLDRLKNYDWIGLVSKVGDGLAKYYDIMTNFFTKVNPDIVAFLAVWAGPIGRMLQTAGGAVSGLGGVIGNLIRFFGKGKVRQLEEAAEGAGALGRTARSFKSAFAGMGLVAGGVAIVGEVGAVIAEYVKIGEMIGKADWGNFDQNIGKVGDFIARVSGITGALLAGGFLVGKSKTASLALGIGEGLAAGAVAIVGAIGGVIAEYVAIADKVANMSIPSDNRIAELGKTITALNTEVLGKVKKVPNKSVRSMENLAEMTEYAADIAKALKNVKDVGQIGDMSKRIGNIVKATNEILKAGYNKTDKKASGIAKDTLANMAESAESIKGISSALVTMKDNVQQLVVKGDATEINNLTSGMDKILSSLATVMHDFQFRSREFETGAANMETIASGVEAIGTIASTLVGARDNINALLKKDHGHLTTDIGNQIGIIMDSLVGPLSKYVFKTKEYEVSAQNLGRFAKMAEAVGTVASTLVGAMDNLNLLTRKTEHGGRYVMSDSDMISKITSVFKNMKTLADNVTKMEIDTSGEAKEKVDALSDVVNALPAMLDSLTSIQEPLNALGVGGESWTLGDNLKTVITGVKGAFDGLSSADYTDLSANATALKEACDQLAPILTALQNVQTNIGSLGIADGVWQAGENLGIAIRTITGIFDNTNSIGAGANVGQLLGDAASNLSAIADTLGTLATNAGDAAAQLKSAAEQLANLGNVASTHKQAIADAGDAAKKLKSGVSGIGGNARDAAAGISTLGEQAQAQVGSLRAAAGAASALASAINSIPSQKTVTVSTAGNLGNSAGNAFGRILGSLFANGGVVYRAGGGTLFRPRGTDTVPAMLTPGEFVMRRRAHSAFGTEFMKRVNALDVDGAMRALSLRAGSGVFRRAAITNNYTRDNHANVTFNVNRATQGYSQRRASRWARALS